MRSWLSLTLRHGIGFVALRVTIELSSKRRARGLEVVLVDETPDDDQVVANVAAALTLIQTHDAIRFQRLMRDLERVLVTKAGGPQYLPPVRGCLLDTRTILTTSSARLALMLVHEGTHARLWESGFRYEPEVRSRIEHICMSAELAFARRLPDSEDLITRAQQNLAGPGWWDDDTGAARQQRDLEAMGAPRWFSRSWRRQP